MYKRQLLYTQGGNAIKKAVLKKESERKITGKIKLNTTYVRLFRSTPRIARKKHAFKNLKETCSRADQVLKENKRIQTRLATAIKGVL